MSEDGWAHVEDHNVYIKPVDIDDLPEELKRRAGKYTVNGDDADAVLAMIKGGEAMNLHAHDRPPMKNGKPGIEIYYFHKGGSFYLLPGGSRISSSDPLAMEIESGQPHGVKNTATSDLLFYALYIPSFSEGETRLVPSGH